MNNPLVPLARQQYAALCSLARADAMTFAEMLLKDEETGKPITLAPYQHEWFSLADSGQNLVFITHPSAGKTNALSIARSIWLLGRNPAARIVVVCATEKMSKKIIGSVRRYIETSPVVRDVFPKLKRGDLWQDTALTVQRPANREGIKDPSIEAMALHSGALQGARVDCMVFDDILTEENTMTEYQREKTARWCRSSAMSRLSTNGQVLFLANAWHPEDYAHVLEREGGWVVRRYPLIKEDGTCNWPEQWTPQRIARQKIASGPIEWARGYLCQARDDSAARFQLAWIEACKARGKGYPLVHEISDLAYHAHLNQDFADFGGYLPGFPLPHGYFTVTGVDLGVKKKLGADFTVFFTLLVHPDGTRQVLNIERGRFTGPEIVERAVSTHERYGSVIIIESNQGQDFVLQFAKEKAPNLPLLAFNTGRNKWSEEFGVESIAAELAATSWIIPCSEAGKCGPDVEKWIQGMLWYDPAEHTPDELMSCWFAREAARVFMSRKARRSSKGNIRILGA